MITRDEVEALLTGKESFRVERTVSTTDKDKFGEAVCAFANDMPDSGKPGYLLVGVRDDGSLNGLKARSFKTFDARPCFETSLDDLDLDLFTGFYLPRAMDAEALASDDRPLERKMESLRLFNSAYNCPTYAAIILFGKQPTHFLPGAFVQYVEFGGEDKASGVVNENAFKECLVKALPKIDTFIETGVVRKFPVKVSALREETVRTYPKWAIRELAMNAIMHRDYQGNAPVRLYQFKSSIEIQNHGGLYGRVRPENFPNINDYRNPIIAEAMKTLGYVNGYNIGIAEVQRRLKENGNPQAEFDISLVTAFRVQVQVRAGRNVELGEKLGENRRRILEVFSRDSHCSIPVIAKKLKISTTAVENNISWLKQYGYLRRVGPDKGGHWEVVS